MKYFLLVFSVALFISCNSSRTVLKNNAKEDDTYIIVNSMEDMEERLLEEIKISAPRGYELPVYNPSSTRTFDLIHTTLDLRFDWINEHVIGRAEISAKPYFYPQETLVLDAKGFDILSISDTEFRPYTYTYNGKELAVNLGRSFTRKDTVNLVIDYIAKPSEGEEGGSIAISSDQGLFFINPRGEQAAKPMQIWTQGETENNSRWFPTIDKPNENMTQIVQLTVPDSMITLSNGLLTRSLKNGDGTRTDRWEQKDPHAPYLTMIAVGDFAVVTEKWNDIELNYIVEKEYEPYAKQIFAHTPEMLQFFSDLLGYKYPWEKYSQIIVRDYVSGAMENTTAVIFGEFIQKTDRELIDNHNDHIVAHEMFHHWFGDLVTCESWANLTLQEGFANYSEYLWDEYKHGRDAADHHRINELAGYLASTAQTGRHALIWYGYGNKEEMFDGHSYNKGGLVLHMLRHHLGDEAFFASLNKYLVDNAYTSVEVDELRMAFEDVSGRDLNWFFDQWYKASGHPELEIEWEYDDELNRVYYSVSQVQSSESNSPIFQLPVTIQIFAADGSATDVELWINKREQIFEIPALERPALVLFDKYDALLYQKVERKSNQEYINQYKWSQAFRHRHEAVNQLRNKKDFDHVALKALTDNHHSIRTTALSSLSKKENNHELISHVKKMAIEDPHSSVRGAAIKALYRLSYENIGSIIDQAIENEHSYQVLNDGIETLNKIDKSKAIQLAISLKDEKTSILTKSVAPLLAEIGDIAHSDYFEQRLNNVSLYSVFNFYEAYFDLLTHQKDEVILEKCSILKNIATSSNNHFFYRYAATNLIHSLKEFLQGRRSTGTSVLGKIIEDIKETESHPMLLQRYESF